MLTHEYFAHLVIPFNFPNGRSVAAWYIPVLSQGCTTREIVDFNVHILSSNLYWLRLRQRIVSNTHHLRRPIPPALLPFDCYTIVATSLGIVV